MRWTLKLSAIGAAALAALTLGAAPAKADSVNFSLQLGRFSPSYNTTNCYWQRFDRGRYDVVRQICRDRYGRTFVVPGSTQTIRDRDRRNWRNWDRGEWRRYDNVRDWDRDRRDWDRDRNRRDRDRWDNDRGRHDRDRDRDRDRRDRDRDRGGRR